MVQMPSEVAPSTAEQASQAPLQAVPQQTPSTQNPDAHWEMRLQGAETACAGTQSPDVLHQFPAEHWLSLVHEVGQFAVAPVHV
jgi:hypothetical protein